MLLLLKSIFCECLRADAIFQFQYGNPDALCPQLIKAKKNRKNLVVHVPSSIIVLDIFWRNKEITTCIDNLLYTSSLSSSMPAIVPEENRRNRQSTSISMKLGNSYTIQ